MEEHFGKCALCWNETVLELSHIVPKLVIRELKKTSVGAIRNTANPNGTVQDGEKHYMLCGDCEDLFNVYETEFAKAVFHPYVRGESDTFNYDEKLFYLLTSISWRSLYQDLLDFVPNHVVGIDALECLIESEKIMRDFLLHKRTDIGTIENHIFFFDQVISMEGTEHGISSAEARPNETMHRSVSSYTSCDEVGNTYFTITNMMGLVLITYYKLGPNERLVNTKVVNGIGTIAAKNQQMQSSACGEFSYMMQNATEAASSMSENQKQKVIERIKKVGEDIVNSAAYKDWVNDQNIKR